MNLNLDIYKIIVLLIDIIFKLNIGDIKLY